MAAKPKPRDPKHFVEPAYYPSHWTLDQVATARRAFQYLQDFVESYFFCSEIVPDPKPIARKFSPLRSTK